MMADTLLNVIQRGLRKVFLDPDVSTFSDNDETQWMVDRVNEWYSQLRETLPGHLTYFDKDGTFSLVNGTRLYNIASDAMLSEIYQWSIENETESDAPMKMMALPDLKRLYPRYDEETGIPTIVYVEQGKMGFYPVPNASFTINYKYRQLPTRLASPTDTFLIPDNWIRYIEYGLELDYKANKGFGDVSIEYKKLEDMKTYIYVEMEKLAPSGFVGRAWRG